MPVPTSISELSTTPGLNSPAGSDAPSVLDDHARTAYAFIKTLDNDKAASSATVNLTGNQTIAGVKTFSSTPVVPDASFGLAKLSNISTARILGRDTAGSGVIEQLTAAEVITLLGLSTPPAGMIAPFAQTTAPSGWLALPLTATNISRTTYAALFAAIGTTWGAGDGSTTFGCPYMPENYAPVQANANVGSSTAGVVIAHTHTMTGGLGAPSGGANNVPFSSGVAGSGGTTQSTGGAANLAAGLKFLYCVKL